MILDVRPHWKSENYLIALAVAGVFLLNILQALFTELGHDEAYYWVWSRYPDWGYFDHPPIVAFLIAIGYSVLSNELGVRFLFVFLSATALFLVYLMTDRKNPALYCVIVFSTSLFWLGGFIAAPDIPLFFFASLFFLWFKEYLEQDTVRSTLFLSLIIPLMLYSKYFGILVVAFSLLANMNLLQRKTFWIIAIVSFILFLPHILWQAHNDWPSLKYHLEDRLQSGYRVELTIRYLMGQVMVMGPLIGFITLVAAVRYRTQTPFERTLKWNLVGILTLFFLITFRTKVHENWTATAFIPLLILSYKYISQHRRAKQWTFYFAIPSIALMMLWRIHLVFPLVQIPHEKTREFRGWESFTNEVLSRTNGLPIIANTYQLASKLAFYSHTIVPALSVGKRKSQFDLWRFENALQGNDVLYVTYYPLEGGIPMQTPDDETVYLKRINSMRTYSRVRVMIDEGHLQFPHSETASVEVRIRNGHSLPITEQPGDLHPLALSYRLYRGNTIAIPEGLRTRLQMPIERDAVQKMQILLPDEPGRYIIEPYLMSDGFAWWGDGHQQELVVY